MLDERMRELARRSVELLRYVAEETRAIEAEIEAAKRAWPAAQMVPTNATDWRPPSEPTPAGTVVWATDGTRVWTLWGTGNPIPGSATAVKAWTVAFIPSPPASLQLIEGNGDADA